MVTPVLYPYTLEKVEKAVSAQNSRGNFVNTADNFVCVCKCRSEKSTATKVIVIGERTNSKANRVAIYCPKGTPALPAGTKIRVMEDCGTVRIAGQIVDSESNRMHTVQWLQE